MGFRGGKVKSESVMGGGREEGDQVEWVCIILVNFESSSLKIC